MILSTQQRIIVLQRSIAHANKISQGLHRLHTTFRSVATGGGGAGEPKTMAPSSAKFQNFSQNDPFVEIFLREQILVKMTLFENFSPRGYILSTLSKSPHLAAANFFPFWNLGPSIRGSHYGPDINKIVCKIT